MIGSLSIITSVLITLWLFLLSKQNVSVSVSIWQYMAQISGLVGLILLGWNYILATRIHFVEHVFSGLDNVYKKHQLVGHLAFILLVNHPLFLVINSLPSNATKLYLLPNISNLPYLFGISSLYLLLVLLVITVYVDMPYKFWKKTHELMGIVIILGSIHSLLISSDVSRFFPLRVWIILWNLLAISSFLYKKYLYYLIRRKNNYQVLDILHEKNYLLLTLKATNINRILSFRPGQFAFFSIGSSSEEHPFSILEQTGAVIKIGTKVVGQFTLSLTNLKKGDYISVNGPYGFFGDSISRAKEMIWISGGIGITPFVSMTKAMLGHSVTLIHTSRSTESNIFTDLIRSHFSSFPNYKFVHHFSDLSGRLNFNFISNYVSVTSNTYVYLCGPSQMMNNMIDEFSRVGIKKKRIIYEDFRLK